MKKLFLVWFVFSIVLLSQKIISPQFSELKDNKCLREEVFSSQFSFNSFNSFNSSASIISAMPMAEACHCDIEWCNHSNPKPNEALS